MSNEIQQKLNDLKKKESILYRWVRLYQSGFKLNDCLTVKGWKNIAVYGYNDICRCILYELKDSNIKIKYIIDKKAGSLPISYPQVQITDVIQAEIDAIIICITNEDYIKQLYEFFNEVKIYTFEEIIYDL